MAYTRYAILPILLTYRHSGCFPFLFLILQAWKMFGYCICWKIAKNKYEYKPLSNCLKCFPDSIKDSFQILLLVTQLPTRKNWNKSEKLNMVEGVWCQNIIVTKDFGTFIYITIMLHHCDTTKPIKQLFDVREGCIATRIILSKSSLMRLFPRSENSLSGFRFKFKEALHSRIGECHRRLPRTVTLTRDRFIK